VDLLLDRFDKYIQGGINKRVYHRQLMQRVRSADEDLNSWLVDVKDLMGHSQIRAGAMGAEAENQLLFDCLVLNINDADVTEKLLLLPEVTTTQEAITLALAMMAAHKDAATVVDDP
jgi:hypothetical protein